MPTFEVCTNLAEEPEKMAWGMNQMMAQFYEFNSSKKNHGGKEDNVKSPKFHVLATLLPPFSVGISSI
jgi:hypothetical protein